MSNEHHPHPEHPPKEVTIKLGDFSKEIPTGTYTGAQIKAMANVPATDVLEYQQGKKLIPLGDNLSLIHISEPTRPY